MDQSTAWQPGPFPTSQEQGGEASGTSLGTASGQGQDGMWGSL